MLSEIPPSNNLSDMQGNQDKIPQSRSRMGWALLLLLCGLIWMGIFLFFIQIPTDPENQAFAGISARRLAIIFSVAAIGLIHLMLTWLVWQGKQPADLLYQITNNNRDYNRLLKSCIILSTFFWVSALIYKNFMDAAFYTTTLGAILERAFPMVIALILEPLIIAIGSSIIRFGVHLETIRSAKVLWKVTGIIFGTLLLIWGMIGITGIGITAEDVGWGEVATPLLFYQVILPWLLGVIILIYSANPVRSSQSPKLSRGLDGLLILSIWLITFLVWSSQPIPRSFFAPSITPPNFEIYPYSDAGYYDFIAQSIQIGYGFLDGQVVPRPLFIVLLALFHGLVGQSYIKIILLQTGLLAFIPVFLFLIGKELHSRPLGLALSALAIFREINAIHSTPWADVSHSKLIMADLPTLLAILVFTWLIIRWFKLNPDAPLYAFLAGGSLGITMLLRTQAFVFFPSIFLIGLWVYWKNWKSYLRACTVFIIGLMLVVSPWLLRNKVISGSWQFDHPVYAAQTVGERYLLGTNLGGQLEGEGDLEYVDRISKIARNYLISHPDIFIGFTTAHLINNGVSTVLDLPTKFSAFQTCDTLIICSPFWLNYPSIFSSTNLILTLLNLFFFSLGIASSWRRWRINGVIPLLIYLIYSLSNAIARNSGRRYILPVDWVGYTYLMLGLFDFALWSASLLGMRYKLISEVYVGKRDAFKFQELKGKFIIWGIGFLLIGLSLPVADQLIPSQYPRQSQVQLFESMVKIPLGVLDYDKLNIFIQQEPAVIVAGRALYPRYYPPNAGEPGNGWPAYKPYEYRQTKKIGFLMVGPGGVHQVNLAIDQIPEYFPNAVDALVLGCQEEGYIDALIVALMDGSEKIIIRSPLDNLQCPMK